MFLFLFGVLLVLKGGCQSQLAQTLTCSHEPQQQGLPRIWCKQNSTLCCQGFTFHNGTLRLESEGVQVQSDHSSFTVTVLQLTQGPGVYWCGLLDQDQTIIKLAEGYFYDNTPLYIWSILRWILLPILPLSVISVHLYTSRKAHNDEKGMRIYEEIHLTSRARRQGDVQHEDSSVPGQG